jgi:hypothetical protein
MSPGHGFDPIRPLDVQGDRTQASSRVLFLEVPLNRGLDQRSEFSSGQLGGDDVTLRGE